MACKRLKDGELLILATNANVETAADDYRKRLQIETLFAACKTCVFNLGDTHITRSSRIKKLLAVLAIAFFWAHRTGEWQAEKRAIQIKTHGRRAQFLSRYGFDRLRQLLENDIPNTIRLLYDLLCLRPPIGRSAMCGR